MNIDKNIGKNVPGIFWSNTHHQYFLHLKFKVTATPTTFSTILWKYQSATWPTQERQVQGQGHNTDLKKSAPDWTRTTETWLLNFPQNRIYPSTVGIIYGEVKCANRRESGSTPGRQKQTVQEESNAKGCLISIKFSLPISSQRWHSLALWLPQVTKKQKGGENHAWISGENCFKYNRPAEGA